MKLSPEPKTLPLVMLVLLMASSAVQETRSHPCGSTFFSALVQLIPCRASVAPFSPIPPSEACCASVKALGQPCLCVLITGPPISGVDRSMAMQLPDKCAANFEPCTPPLLLLLLLPPWHDNVTFSSLRFWVVLWGDVNFDFFPPAGELAKWES